MQVKSLLAGCALACAVMFTTFWAAASRTPTSRVCELVAVAAMVAWVGVQIARHREWVRPLAVGAVALLGEVAAGHAGTYYLDQQVLARANDYQRVAGELAPRLAGAADEARAMDPLPGIRTAMARRDPETGGVEVQFSYRASPRRGVVVFVGARRPPSLERRSRCLRLVRDGVYSYRPC